MDRLEFAARCHAIGFDALILARAMGISTAKARSWLDTNWDAPVPADATFALKDAEYKQETQVKAMLELIELKCQNAPSKRTVMFPYWTSQQQFDEYNTEIPPMDFRIANNHMVALSHILRSRGYEVGWMRPEKGIAYKIRTSHIPQ